MRPLRWSVSSPPFVSGGPIALLGTFTVSFLRLCLISTVAIQAAAQDAPPSGSAPEPSWTLREVASFLRGYGHDHDLRLVHYDSSDVTAERQGTDACGSHLVNAHRDLSEEDATASDKIDAAAVVLLCTTDNPTHRAKLLAEGDGPVRGLVGMIRSYVERDGGDEEVIDPEQRDLLAHAAAAAGEAIWISAFNSAANHEAFVKAGSVDALADLLCRVRCPSADSSTTDGDSKEVQELKRRGKYHCDLATMWAAGALLNLMASYCTTDSGHCWWEWAEDDLNDPDYEEDEEEEEEVEMKHLHLHPHSKLIVDSEPVRQAVLQKQCLIERLESLIGAGPVTEPHEEWIKPWPTRAEILSPDEYYSAPHASSETLVTWTAIGVIKNLALSPYFMPSPDLLASLCRIATVGPDWLEYTKAEAALYNLGLDESEICELPYSETCVDYEDWVDDDGNGCMEYEHEHWCVEYKHLKNEDGVAAREACCICGGGKEDSGMGETEGEAGDEF